MVILIAIVGSEQFPVGNQRTSRDHSNYSVTEIGQDNEKDTGCHSDSSEKPSANGGVKNLQGGVIVLMMIIIQQI